MYPSIACPWFNPLCVFFMPFLDLPWNTSGKVHLCPFFNCFIYLFDRRSLLTIVFLVDVAA